MPLNKTELLALNQTNFPDNTQQLITPVLLRDFNGQMIGSMELTQSMDGYANLATANIFYGGNQSIAKEYKLFTNGVYWNNNTAGYNNLEIINSITGNIDIAALGGGVRIVSSSLNITNGTFTASLAEGFTYVGNGSGRTSLVSTSSFGTTINTGSFVSTSSFNAYTQSINSATASLFTSASLGLVTASFSGNTLTFTKGDTSTFGVVIPDISGSTIDTGSFATTGSNTFTGNQLIGGYVKITGNDGAPNEYALETDYGIRTKKQLFGNGFVLSGSQETEALNIFYPGTRWQHAGSVVFTNQVNYPVSGAAYEGSGSIDIVAYGGGTLNLTGSQLTLSGVEFIPFSASLNTKIRELMTTGSASGNVLTFSKGDGSTFNLTVATGSGVPTGTVSSSAQIAAYNIFATTGSNNFKGSQNISSSANIGDYLGTDYVFISQNGITLNNATQTNIEFTAANNFFNAGGNFFIQNTLGGVGSGSITMTANNGGNISVSGSQTNIAGVNFIPFSASLDSRINAITGSSINTGSFATTGSNTFTGNQTISTAGNSQLTLTASAGFQTNIEFRSENSNFQAYGDFRVNNNGQFGGSGSIKFTTSNNFMELAADSGTKIGATNGGGNGIDNGNISMQVRSGSLSLAAAGFSNTTASLTHLSSSSNTNNINLVFKPNSNTGTTIISGSSNIFTNPATPTTGYTRYIGGSNNLYLNQTNGINSQITASAASVSGNRPTMNGNIMPGTGDFQINQATNPGTHTYSSNIIFGQGGTTTINALGFTGSLNVNSNISSTSAITVNAASASVAQIATGISGSGTVTITSNLIQGGSITNTSPRTLLTTNTQTMASNVVAGGTITVTNISSSAAVNANSNYAHSALSYTNAGAAGLGLHTTAANVNNNYGGGTIIASGSAVAFNFNTTSGNNLTLTNQAFSGSLGVGLFSVLRNIFYGQNGTLLITGSVDGTGNTTGAFTDNAVIGKNNTIFSNQSGAGLHNSFISNVVGGEQLIISASNSFNSTIGGGAYFGRYNANDGVRNKSGQTVFSVGTGTSTARKTGLLIDSGSNTYVEGSLNVSGSTVFTGSVKVAPTFQLNLPTGSNQQVGTAVLDNASPSMVVVSNTLVTANSIIMVSKQTLTNGHSVAVSSKGAGTFTIQSTGNGDSDTVGYVIWNNT